MSQLAAVVLGVISALPILYGVAFVAYALSLPVGVNPGRAAGGIDWHLIAMILSTALFVWYVVSVFTSSKLSMLKRIVWAIVLFVGNIFVFPVYWYLHVWKERRRSP